MVGCSYGELSKQAAQRLNGVSDSPAADARVLLCHLLGWDNAKMMLNTQEQASSEVCLAFMKLVERRAQNEPVAYITGNKDFMSLRFKVSPSVLIPRPETEVLVETVIEQLKDKQARILDLCTGSGCIAVALAKYLPDSTVVAVDISEDALAIARENAFANGVDRRIEFICCDILKDNCFGQEYDVIVSNPPYIRSDDVLRLMPDVREYEPHLALDGGCDGYVFYRRIAEICKASLKEGGLIAVEVGEGQSEETVKVFSDILKDISVINDFSGINRVVTGIKKL